MLRASPKLLAALVVTLLVAPAAFARTYYVSPHGRDWSSGRSPGRAWRTLFRVDKAGLRPGDVVLFQGGARFGDQVLMPGWGLSVSGTGRSPVVFGSYGRGAATLTQGVWIKGERHLVFENLNMGPVQGVEGTGSYDTVEYCSIGHLMGGMQLGINVIGSHWVIAHNRIDHTGDSGMLLRGDRFLVAHNTITNTGLDSGLGYGRHGVYLKASGSTVTGNTIIGFHDNGVSVRYRNSVVSDNFISGGTFGIAWFQYDGRPGLSRWVDNTIMNARSAGIYVSPSDVGGSTRESFVIAGNRIYRPGGRIARASSGWRPISLSHTAGRYAMSGNVVIRAAR